MARKKRQLGNKGFSLLELLVAVMILGIVAAPLLHAMVTSARTAAKSRALHSETLTAQNIVETFDALEVSNILTEIINTGTLSGLSSDARFYTYDADEGTYTAVPIPIDLTDLAKQPYYIGLKNVSLSSASYDAMVKLDAVTAYTTGVNEKDVSIYTDMNVVFLQPKGTVYDPDLIAADDFARQASEQIASSSGTPTEVDAAAFTNSMVRTIKIYVIESGSTVDVWVKYVYSADYSYDDDDDDGTPEVSLSLAEVEVDSGLVDTKALADFSSVHFFYYPYYNPDYPKYDGGKPVYCDNIIISNNYSDTEDHAIIGNSALAFRFFAVKQYTPAVMPGYQAKLVLMEPYKELREEPEMDLYWNMNESDSLLQTLNGGWQTTSQSSGTLVATDQLKRLYQITVTLYPAYSDFTGDAEYTFDASKVD